MKNQYFGDVNDYRKYGLLRQFAAAGLETTLGWMLTPDDGSTDGQKLSYLSRPLEWKTHDPQLFASLKALRDAEVERRVSSAGEPAILPDARFYRQLVPSDRSARERWLESLLETARGSDLVFLDPDNGLEVASVPLGTVNSKKYVYWPEITSLFESGFSLLVYQHFPRKKRSEYIPEMGRQLALRTQAAAVEAFATSHVLFLLAAQERHVEALEVAMKAIRGQWRRQISAWGLWQVERPRHPQ